MRYRDLVQFEPIESVIQLRSADNKQQAAHLVETYVVSDRMADQLANLVFPQLRIDRPHDNKGVLVVGNYGTGKSHLMSLVSAVAEHGDLASLISHPRVREAATPIAGRFKVVRTEIGGVERGLRDIIFDELERFLAEVGTPYTFPPATQVTNNKTLLIEAMAGFQQRYPDMGVLFVLDELLDYLRTREERALILDLGVLREIGEVSAVAPFRFIAGVQETLFDNPRFGFVAEQLRRVRDRFEQVRIAREDIAFVVAERLLRKSDSQLAQITQHLRQFTTLYPPLADRLSEYARLFPIHPAYIDTFERVYVAEKREVLQTFSRAIRSVLDRDVPAEQPGLISYDHYWGILTDNPSLRTLPGVVDVVEKSGVLEGRVRNAYTRPALRDMALRIIHALSVHRLTTSDINAPIGVTVEELRDQLMLWVRLPQPDAELLADQVRIALREILRTVSGQYISANNDNGQYYLNLRKDIDFDARIEERGRFMEERDLNRYFFDALQRLLNITASTHVTNFRIWPYELPWAAKNVTRPGYLFFGPPDERSTAQPPRDFYLYVLPPFGATQAVRPGQVDEVILSLEGLDDDFKTRVRAYAGAQALTAESPTYRQTYQDKADEHLRGLVGWLRENFVSRLRISAQGQTETVAQALARTRSSASRDVEALLRLIAADKLAPHFAELYPDYPDFRGFNEPLSEAGRPGAALDAIRFLARRTGRTVQAAAVLEGLKLLDAEGRVKPIDSPYARHLLEILREKAPTQVVNRGEVIAQVAGGLLPIEKEKRFHLEPEWVAVLLVALVQDGQITLNLDGTATLDAGNIERAAITSVQDLAAFRFYRRPKEVPEANWVRIFEALDLLPGLIRDESERDKAVTQLQARVHDELERVVDWQGKVQGGLSLWNRPLMTDRFTIVVEGGAVMGTAGDEVTLSQTDVLPYLRKTKEFLETLSRFDARGKLQNLALSQSDVQLYLGDRERALRIGHAMDIVAQLQPLTGYLGEASALLPSDHPWVGRANEVREELLTAVRRMFRNQGDMDVVVWRRRLEDLRRDYVAAYTDLHNRYVLQAAGIDRRLRLLRDPRLARLQTLSGVEILNRAELDRWRAAVEAIPSCDGFHEGLLTDSPRCPVCHFNPSQAGGPSATTLLDQLEARLESLGDRWHAALRENLRSETAQHSLAAMTAAERRPLDDYLARANGWQDDLPVDFVTRANEALRGLDTLALDTDALLAALAQGGLPATSQQLQARFAAFVRDAMHGHDARNTRLTFDPTSNDGPGGSDHAG